MPVVNVGNETHNFLSPDDMSAQRTVPSLLPVGTVYEGDLPSVAPPPRSQTSPPVVAAATGQTGQTSEGARRKREERKLAIMMMSKKRRRLLEQIMKSRRLKSREVGELKRKRREYEDNRLLEDSKRTKVIVQ